MQLKTEKPTIKAKTVSSIPKIEDTVLSVKYCKKPLTKGSISTNKKGFILLKTIKGWALYTLFILRPLEISSL